VSDGSKQVVSADAAALSPSAKKFTAWLYPVESIGSRPDKAISYELRKDGSVSTYWSVSNGAEWSELLLQISSRKVPKLPAMSSLKR